MDFHLLVQYTVLYLEPLYAIAVSVCTNDF